MTAAEVDTLQAKMKVPRAEKRLIYAEVNTRKEGLTHAEVDARRNGAKDHMNEEDMGITMLQATNQEGWSVNKVIAEAH